MTISILGILSHTTAKALKEIWAAILKMPLFFENNQVDLKKGIVYVIWDFSQVSIFMNRNKCIIKVTRKEIQSQSLIYYCWWIHETMSTSEPQFNMAIHYVLGLNYHLFPKNPHSTIGTKNNQKTVWMRKRTHSISEYFWACVLCQTMT